MKKGFFDRDHFHNIKDWDNYKLLRNKTTALIRKSKKEYYNNAVKNGTSTTNIWKNLKMISNNDNDQNCGVNLPNKILVNGVYVEEKSRILISLNEHFTNI